MRLVKRQLKLLSPYTLPMCLLLMPFGVAKAENIAMNPSFEIEGRSGPQWAEYWGGQTWGRGTAARSDVMASDGNWGMRISTAGVVNGLTSHVNVTQTWWPPESSRLDVSFDAYVDLSGGGSASVVFSIFSGIRPERTIATSGVLPLEDTGLTYRTFDIGSFVVPEFGPPPADVYRYRIEFQVESDYSPMESAEVFLDNVVIDAVPIPEPAGWFLAVCCLPGFLHGRYGR